MKKIKFEIKNRWSGDIIFEYESENNTMKKTVEKAIEERADLSGANLRSANLSGANLRSADLRSADLSGADLSGADLKGSFIEYSDEEIDNIDDTVKEFTEDTNIEITKTYINHDVIPTQWNCWWNYGLIISEWNVKGPFKVRDIIKGNSESNKEYSITNENMLKAEVIELDHDGQMNVKILNHNDSDYIGDTLWVDNTDLYFEKIDNEVKEMTVEEISEALGYEVKVVKS